MHTTDPSAEPEVRPIAAARANVATVQHLLRTPPIVAGLASCGGALEAAIACLREMATDNVNERTPRGSRIEAEALARDVNQINALLGQAVGFYTEWARVLSGDVEDYDCRGLRPVAAPAPHVVCEG